MVNIEFMAQPLGLSEFIPSGKGDGLAWLFVEMFCEGKFYPLFSLLFGMGLVLQMENVKAAGGSFVPLYLRRLFFLACIGLTHGFAIWFGDILFIYSVAGTLLLIASGLSGRWLLGISGVLWAMAALVMVGVSSLGALEGGDLSERPSREEMSARAAEVELPESILDIISEGDVESAEWIAAETSAFRDGPTLRSAGFRAASYFFAIFITLFAGLDILAMFALGAALVKLRLFDEEVGEIWVPRLLGAAMFIGMPLSALGAVLPLAVQTHGSVALAEGFRVIGGPFLSLGYLSAAILLVQADLFGRALELLAAAGRMALTNYLAQSVLATFVMYHWGLGKFGSFSGVERMLFVVTVFLAQLAFSRFWMTHFRFGPMEWIWRSLTYWKRQPLRKHTR